MSQIMTESMPRERGTKTQIPAAKDAVGCYIVLEVGVVEGDLRKGDVESLWWDVIRFAFLRLRRAFVSDVWIVAGGGVGGHLGNVEGEGHADRC